MRMTDNLKLALNGAVEALDMINRRIVLHSVDEKPLLVSAINNCKSALSELEDTNCITNTKLEKLRAENKELGYSTERANKGMFDAFDILVEKDLEIFRLENKLAAMKREGWVSVPSNPTSEMVEAMVQVGKENEKEFRRRDEGAIRIYKAMLSELPNQTDSTLNPKSEAHNSVIK